MNMTKNYSRMESESSAIKKAGKRERQPSLPFRNPLLEGGYYSLLLN